MQLSLNQVRNGLLGIYVISIFCPAILIVGQMKELLRFTKQTKILPLVVSH
jgi:hypothetical protein